MFQDGSGEKPIYYRRPHVTSRTADPHVSHACPPTVPSRTRGSGAESRRRDPRRQPCTWKSVPMSDKEKTRTEAVRGPLRWRAEQARPPKEPTRRERRVGAVDYLPKSARRPFRDPSGDGVLCVEAAGKVHRDAANRRSSQTRPGPSLPPAAPRGKTPKAAGRIRPSVGLPPREKVRNWPGRGGRAPPAEFPRSSLALRGSLPVTTERVHVLLNPLFRVLCNFPSRYLFAIGLVVIFSLT